MVTSSSSSSFLCHVKRNHVFPSFHGPDTRRGLRSHLRNFLACENITMFNDDDIVRGHKIGPELVRAIREARVSIVLFSKNYASSRWCLDELLEILKCEEDSGQIVMPIFYDVDPSDVRKQKGVFGAAFEKTCQGETEEQKQRWVKALSCVATIAGEHSRNWKDEAAMLKSVSTDVLNKLTVEDRKKCFSYVDIDHDGFITAPELRYVMSKDGGQVNNEDVSNFIRTADADGDSRISFNEFLKIMKDIRDDPLMSGKFATDVFNKLKAEGLKKRFSSVDVDHNGYITAPELRYAMTKDGGQVTDEEVLNIFREADVNGDGCISYDEFIKVVAKIDETMMVGKFATDKSNKLKVEELKNCFRSCDVDHSGFITAPELRYVMTKDGAVVTDEDVCNIFRAADVDNDGRISCDEFIKLMMAMTDEAMLKKIATDVSNKLKVKELKKRFSNCDIDQNGFITAPELRYVMSKDGAVLTDEDVCNIIRKADVNGDGQISFDEFVKLMTDMRITDAEKLATDALNKLNKFAKLMIKSLNLLKKEKGFMTCYSELSS